MLFIRNAILNVQWQELRDPEKPVEEEGKKSGDAEREEIVASGRCPKQTWMKRLEIAGEITKYKVMSNTQKTDMAVKTVDCR